MARSAKYDMILYARMVTRIFTGIVKGHLLSLLSLIFAVTFASHSICKIIKKSDRPMIQKKNSFLLSDLDCSDSDFWVLTKIIVKWFLCSCKYLII